LIGELETSAVPLPVSSTSPELETRFSRKEVNMAMICPRCGSNEIRSSRQRSTDLLYALFFHRPVRCRSCLQRMHVSLFAAKRLQRERKAIPS
jgi:predicted RNA-binding Zn-ribbon protein involved in translation (DUF1610 family)